MHMPIDREAIRANPAAVGFAVPHLEVRLVAAGRDVAAGEVGEIWLRGPSVSPGYWQRPAETAAAFTDGWYRSGDLARQDENGAYRIVDRLKDMYVSGGENVYPAEIEAVLLTHPGVADAAVVGVPDARWGEAGVAFVVSRPGATLTELAAHCAGRIARYKCPARFIEIAAIPRSAAGKALKSVLRDQLKETT
jgi:fatty-acyl-CoA synthase